MSSGSGLHEVQDRVRRPRGRASISAHPVVREQSPLTPGELSAEFFIIQDLRQRFRQCFGRRRAYQQPIIHEGLKVPGRAKHESGHVHHRGVERDG